MRIENLPDELFLYIFSFIEPKDLLKGWYNLNYHINMILRSVDIRINIKNNDDFNNSLPYFKHFCSQITHLKDERFFPNTQIDLRSLIKIRFLYLTHCSKEQYQHINPNNQPYLTHFFFSSLPWSFYERILFEQARFPYLISIGCPRGTSIYLLSVTNPINRTIRHLHLHSASNEIIYKFIQYLPSIISLTIDYLYTNSSSSPLLFTDSRVRRLNIVNSLSSQFHLEQLLLSVGFSDLTDLCITFDTCDFHQLAYTLTRFSCLKHFNLRVNTYHSGLNLIATRLMSPWFLSLNYEHIINRYSQKQAILINNIRK
ncbi:unnamed protein product [Adineta steineri]|uniref:F-box domain-containing protein n=1 Tax=Adineta steineri TaxID=433720 RepID=A0A815LDB9_9BILA|nr:unnamed protein product [Adineta steineri]CAF1405524.1 unnamed protein product [Adineta steineri]